ncbi:MAG: hypothetical protein ACAI38_04915 [Myxococcota bacterium]|nr:hypothetical protein [Myxococcota bacterium]
MGPTTVKESIAPPLNIVGASSLTGREVVPVASAGQSMPLAVAASLIREQDSSFERVTYGKADFHNGPFVRAKNWCARNDLNVDGSNSRVAVGFVGIAGALAATIGYHVYVNTDPNVITAITGALIAAPFLGSRYVVGAIDSLAARSIKKALRRQVQLEAVRPSIVAFRESVGVEKALRGTVLTSWFELMDTKRALSGPARVELMRVKQELEALRASDRNDASRLFELTKLVDAKGDVSSHAVDAIVSQLQTASDDERAALAQGVVQLLHENGRDVDYVPGHKLHELTIEKR